MQGLSKPQCPNQYLIPSDLKSQKPHSQPKALSSARIPPYCISDSSDLNRMQSIQPVQSKVCIWVICVLYVYQCDLGEDRFDRWLREVMKLLRHTLTCHNSKLVSWDLQNDPILLILSVGNAINYSSYFCPQSAVQYDKNTTSLFLLYATLWHKFNVERCTYLFYCSFYSEINV